MAVLDATNSCFNALTSGQQLAAIYGLLEDILAILDPMAEPNPLEYAANPCFNHLPSGQMAAAIWGILGNIFDVGLVGGGNAIVSAGTGEPEGVVVGLSASHVYVQVDGGIFMRLWYFNGTVGTNNGWV